MQSQPPELAPAPTARTANGERMQRARKVAKTWAVLLAVLTVPTLGLPGYLRKLVDDSGVLTVLQTIWVTVPLTLAVAVIAYRLFAKRSVTPLSVTITLAVALLAIGAIGLASGRRAVTDLFSPDVVPCLDANSPCLQRPDQGTLTVPLRVLTTYWHFYGVVGFFSAIVIGTFVGWSASVLLGRRGP